MHNKFPHRAPDDRALLRCFIGGARNEQILQTPDEEVIRIVREELQQILGLTADPLFTRVYRWKGAMAQYGVGHLERLQRIEDSCNNFLGWRWPATDIAESECPIASVLEARRQIELCSRLDCLEVVPTGIAS